MGEKGMSLEGLDDRDDPVVPTGAPRLGEHTRAVLTDLLGLEEPELDALAADGVI